MCEFCVKHGEGGKWYLRAENYAEDLLSDLRRRRFIEGFLSDIESLRRDKEWIERLARAPKFVWRAVAWGVTRHMKRVHFGQVVPVEDLERIFGFVTSVTRLPCLCRKLNLGRESRYCYALSLSPEGGELLHLAAGLDRSYLKGPEAGDLEALTPEEALRALREHESEGLCHTIWTFVTPFIGAICNCDRSDCLALSTTVTHGASVLFRAEYVAAVDFRSCTGCRSCMKSCQFGAMTYSAAAGKAVVDAKHCYGCGVCRATCPASAIRLLDRATVPAAAAIW